MIISSLKAFSINPLLEATNKLNILIVKKNPNITRIIDNNFIKKMSNKFNKARGLKKNINK